MANMPLFCVIYRSKLLQCDRTSRGAAWTSRFPIIDRSAALANILQTRIHDRVFRADRIHVFRVVDVRSRIA